MPLDGPGSDLCSLLVATAAVGGKPHFLGNRCPLSSRDFDEAATMLTIQCCNNSIESRRLDNRCSAAQQDC